MKKSLVALAALAVVGAASAQVSITGTTSFSYQTSLTGKQGIAMSDNSIFLGDTEDLGGGAKLVMSTGFDAGGRNNATGGGNFGQENSSLTVSGSFGAVKLQSYESDGPFAAVEGLSGASLDVGMFDSNAAGLAKRFRNGISYVAPSMAGFTPALTYVTLAGQYGPNETLGEKTKVVPAVTYKAGALTVYGEYAVFNGSYNASAGATTSADDGVTQPTVTALYDFGAAQVGAGWTKASNDDPVVILGVSVPVGNLTFGLATASYAYSGGVKTTVNGVTTNNSRTANVSASGTATFTEASVAYALSKRTSVKASFGMVNDQGVALANNFTTAYPTTEGLVQNCQYRVGLFHSF